MVRIFLSYRRADTADAADRLFHGLRAALPGAEIFKDTASLAPAQDWMDQVVRAVRAADWCLVLIGSGWLERDAGGALRLESRADVVRLEVATALALGIPTLPVTVDGAAVPPGAVLPLPVARLGRLQRETLSAASFDQDVRRIAGLVGTPRPDAGRTPLPRELSGLWSRTTATAGSSYEFTADGTYVHLSMISQSRPTGAYLFEHSEEGTVDVERDGALRLRPLRASATQKDTGRPELDRIDVPRELRDRTLTWRSVPGAPPRLLVAVDGGTADAYELEWRPDGSAPP